MQENDKKPAGDAISRRDFMQTVAASGAGLMLSQVAFGQATTSTTAMANTATSGTAAQAAPAVIKKAAGEVINVAIIGTGQEGRVLIDACRQIPNLNFVAVCDIWKYSQQFGSGKLRAYGHKNVKRYEDYREMLAQEKELDAVIVATPEWMHAEHAIACMEAGKHVYCEKEMSNSLEKARQMVETSQKTGKLLQIGHQRRSNPRYHHALNEVIDKNKVLGRVVQANAQWNRGVAQSIDLKFPAKLDMPAETLAKYGYGSMHEFLNWRWFKKYGGGPIVDLGSHQIDIFAWVFKNNPKSVIASGGVDFYDSHEWYDNVMCVYEYDGPDGKTTRAFYQVLTTTGNGGYFESFMGVEGSLIISESAQKTKILRDQANAPEWDKWVNAGVIKRPPELKIVAVPTAGTVSDVRETKPPEEWLLPIDMTKPYHQPHLENFFNAIRSGTPLTCPAEVGYETAVAVLAVNDAVAKNQKITFKPEDFKVA